MWSIFLLVCIQCRPVEGVNNMQNRLILPLIVLERCNLFHLMGEMAGKSQPLAWFWYLIYLRRSMNISMRQCCLTDFTVISPFQYVQVLPIIHNFLITSQMKDKYRRLSCKIWANISWRKPRHLQAVKLDRHNFCIHEDMHFWRKLLTIYEIISEKRTHWKWRIDCSKTFDPSSSFRLLPTSYQPYGDMYHIISSSIVSAISKTFISVGNIVNITLTITDHKWDMNSV